MQLGEEKLGTGGWLILKVSKTRLAVDYPWVLLSGAPGIKRSWQGRCTHFMTAV